MKLVILKGNLYGGLFICTQKQYTIFYGNYETNRGERQEDQCLDIKQKIKFKMILVSEIYIVTRCPF